MGRMDVVMKDAIASSLLLSTTPPSTGGAITLIIAHLCVSLPAGDHGKSKVSLSIPSPFVAGMQTLLTPFL